METKEMTIQERNELQSWLLGKAYSSILVILSCDESVRHTKILELYYELKKGIEIIYYGHPNEET